MTAYRLEDKNEKGVIIDFTEYQLRRNGTKDRKATHKKKGISILGGIIAVAGGFVAAVWLIGFFDVEVEKAVFIMYVLWLFCGGALGCLFDEIGM